MRPKRGTFKKYIRKLENINPEPIYCTLPPVGIFSWTKLLNYKNNIHDAIDSFFWDQTPQKINFWSQQHSNSLSNQCLPEEVFRFIEYLLQYKEGRPSCVPLDKWEVSNEN